MGDLRRIKTLPILPEKSGKKNMSTIQPDIQTIEKPSAKKPRILFTSVFGPYAQDDEYGSRTINPMELYHNQVTRLQGPFSLRMFHRSWGLMLLRENVSAPSSMLDFPTLDRFIEEIKNEKYDIFAISAIPPNYLKVKKMCELIREYQPDAKIIVGGHVTGIPNLQERVGADYVVKGEGVRWLRAFLGEDENAPVRHPRISSGVGARTMGFHLAEGPEDIAAVLIPSVGCPMGCNFCATSAAFGGKGKFINFYDTGDDLFKVMVELENDMKVKAFFVMDENFLFHKKRALRLLELMKANGKNWSLYVFSSANVLKSYKIEELVSLGISWVWMGLEGKESQYNKLSGTDTHDLIRTLQSHGINILGSTIIGLEEHTPENIEEAIDHAVSHNTEFHQFMLYTPVPGTPLFEEHKAAGTLVDPDCNETADFHGQLKFAHKHPNIPAGMETDMLLRAFQRDFDVNGPSIMRTARTTLAGYLRYRDSSDPLIRDRFRREGRVLPVEYAASLSAMIRWYRNNPEMRKKIQGLLAEIHKPFGIRSCILSFLGGLYVSFLIKREERRMAQGITIEPPTFYETTEKTVVS